jgi:hypothetical protein
MSRRRSWQKASGSSGTTTVVLGAIGECAGTRARTADPRSTVRRRRSRWTSVLDCCAALANLHRRRVHAGDIPTVAQHLANAHTGVRRSTALKLTPIPHPRSGTINFVRSARRHPDPARRQKCARPPRPRAALPRPSAPRRRSGRSAGQAHFASRTRVPACWPAQAAHRLFGALARVSLLCDWRCTGSVVAVPRSGPAGVLEVRDRRVEAASPSTTSSRLPASASSTPSTATTPLAGGRSPPSRCRRCRARSSVTTATGPGASTSRDISRT